MNKEEGPISPVFCKRQMWMVPPPPQGGPIEEEKAEGSPPPASEAAAAGSGARPSSTTSRDSENDVVTSGYFRWKTHCNMRVKKWFISCVNSRSLVFLFSRQESVSRGGSDETLSSPKSPEGKNDLQGVGQKAGLRLCELSF